MATWQLGVNYGADPDYAREDAEREKLHQLAMTKYFSENPGNENAQSARDRQEQERIASGQEPDYQAIGLSQQMQQGGQAPPMSADMMMRVKRVQAKAQFDAQQMETAYSAKQKVQLQANLAGVERARQSGLFSDDEMKDVERTAQLKNLGVTPQQMFRSSPYPKGQGPTDPPFDVPGVGKVKVGPDGKWQILQGFNKSAESQATKDAAAKERDIQKSVAAYAAKNDIEYKDSDGVIRKRAPNVDEVEDHLDILHGNPPRNQNARRNSEAFNGKPFTDEQWNDARMKERVIQRQMEAAGGGPALTPSEMDAMQKGQVNAPQQTQQQQPQQSPQQTQAMDSQKQAAMSILQDANANPEKLKDNEFYKKASAAAALLEGQQ